MVLVWPPYKNGLPLVWQDVPNGSMLDLRSHNVSKVLLLTLMVNLIPTQLILVSEKR